MIAAMIPHVAAANSAPLVLTEPNIGPRLAACLLANLNSIAMDFVARQKVGGVHLNFFIVEQLPLFGPDRYAERCPWDKRLTLERWISERALKLTCTADDMRPPGRGGRNGPARPQVEPRGAGRNPRRVGRRLLPALLLDREDVQYILGTFRGLGQGADEAGTLFDTGGEILEAYDRLSGGS